MSNSIRENIRVNVEALATALPAAASDKLASGLRGRIETLSNGESGIFDALSEADLASATGKSVIEWAERVVNVYIVQLNSNASAYKRAIAAAKGLRDCLAAARKGDSGGEAPAKGKGK